LRWYTANYITYVKVIVERLYRKGGVKIANVIRIHPIYSTEDITFTEIERSAARTTACAEKTNFW